MLLTGVEEVKKLQESVLPAISNDRLRIFYLQFDTVPLIGRVAMVGNRG